MKKIIIYTVLLLSVVVSYSQSAIGISIYQDNKLAFLEDNHGNKPFTLDLTVKIKLQAEERNIGHWLVSPKFEFAELYGGKFYRYGSEVGYCFTNLPVPFTNIKYALTPYIGGGYIIRYGMGQGLSFETGLELTFKITDWLKLNSQVLWTERTDLPNHKFGFSAATGLQFDITTDYGKKQAVKGTKF